MESRETRVCLYCGKTINYTVREDSWNVGHYGCTKPDILYIGYDCTCKPSKIAKELESSWIQCCQNCKHNKYGNCINPRTLNKFVAQGSSSPFEKTKLTEVPIAKPDMKCDNYESILPSNMW